MIRLFGMAIIFATVATPVLAHRAHHHRHAVHHHHVILHVERYAGMTYLHNYGPGPLPGTIATYDGDVGAECQHGAAAYLGQDRQRHPCN